MILSFAFGVGRDVYGVVGAVVVACHALCAMVVPLGASCGVGGDVFERAYFCTLAAACTVGADVILLVAHVSREEGAYEV